MNSFEQGKKHAEKDCVDLFRYETDQDYRNGVDEYRGMVEGSKVEKDIRGHPISGPVVDALGGYASDVAGKPEAFRRGYDKERGIHHNDPYYRDPRDKEDRSSGGGGGGSGGGSDGGEGCGTVGCLLGGILGLVFLVGIGAAITSPIIDDYRENRRIEREMKLVAEPRKEPLFHAQDYSYSSDLKRVVFSKRIVVPQYGTYDHKSMSVESYHERSRIFLKEGGLEKELGLDINPLNCGLSWEDFIAPLISPDGSKIAFIIGRYDHLWAVHIANSNGTDIRRVSEFYNTIAFGWLPENKIFVWGHYGSNANILDPFIYKRGEGFGGGINDFVPIEGIDFRPRKKGEYVPNLPVRVKYFSESKVQDCILKRPE